MRWFISEAGPSFLEEHGIGNRNAERRPDHMMRVAAAMASGSCQRKRR